MKPQTKVDMAFFDLYKLPQIKTYKVEHKGETYTTKVILNGHIMQGNDKYDPYLCRTLEEAIEKTGETIDKILSEHENVWLRIFPEVTVQNCRYRIYTRLAF